eukprot:377144-Amorphochlora_amoeboformis.AAC.2
MMHPGVNDGQNRLNWISPLRVEFIHLKLNIRVQSRPPAPRELVEQELLHHINPIADLGDPPFYVIADKSKMADAPFDGLGMFFNKGNNAISVQLSVIYEIRMVHIKKVIQPPNAKQMKQLPANMYNETKSMDTSIKFKPLATQDSRSRILTTRVQEVPDSEVHRFMVQEDHLDQRELSG